MTYKIGTKVIHAGSNPTRFEGSLVTPVFQSSTYAAAETQNYEDIKYLRLSNSPNHAILGQRLAALEGTEAALVTGSGMSAITTALLALTGPGEHLIAPSDLYGTTYNFLSRNFPELGRRVSFFNVDDPDSIARQITPQTKIIFIESISNPLLKVPDFEKILALARSSDLTTVIDNTFTSPINFRPAEIGFDVIVHSATKYLNGHSDIVAGVVASSGDNVRKVTRQLNLLGGVLDPHACFLLERGLKTLELRVRRHNETALRLARELEKHYRVKKVNYPALESHPQHARSKKYFTGGGGVFSFDFDGDAVQTDQMLRRLRIAAVAPSLGSVETLVTRPRATTHLGFPEELLNSMGIGPSLVRVSAGIEDADDLVKDFLHALV